ncbi:MAG: NUDIX domain-containing protein [Candidatus Hodarchaeota archaeon]
MTHEPVDQEEELLVVVDEHDRPIGIASRSQCHREGLIHRSVGVVVFNSTGKVLFQRRSKNKDLYPRKFTLSATGHVEVGESYREAAHRELREELGLSCELKFVGTIPALSLSHDKEFVGLFSCVTEKDPQFNKAEIEEVMFIEPDWLFNSQTRSLLAEGLLCILEDPLTRPQILQLLGLVNKD